MNAADLRPQIPLPMGEFHGGNLDWAERVFGRPDAPWIDLSTGINPWPYSFSKIPASAWQDLPTKAAESDLRSKAANQYLVTGPECVASAPGSQALIQLLPRLRRASKVAIFSPTYGEHKAAWLAAGHTVIEVRDEAEIDDNVDVVVVTNPNNPDGRIIDRERLLALHQRLQPRGGWLVVDEAFGDVDEAVSLAPACGRDGLIVLRSFGKFFGLAGVRLGFALTSAALAAEVMAAFGPWAVSGPAIHIATEAFDDKAWQAETLARLTQTVSRLDELLVQGGLSVGGGTLLYRFTMGDVAPDIFQRLGTAGILVRHFPSEPRWLRFGLPADDAAFDRLQNALAL